MIPNVDKAFDLSCITFREDGCIEISPELEQPAVLGINENMGVTLADGHQELLSNPVYGRFRTLSLIRFYPFAIFEWHSLDNLGQ